MTQQYLRKHKRDKNKERGTLFCTTLPSPILATVRHYLGAGRHSSTSWCVQFTQPVFSRIGTEFVAPEWAAAEFPNSLSRPLPW